MNFFLLNLEILENVAYFKLALKLKKSGCNLNTFQPMVEKTWKRTNVCLFLPCFWLQSEKNYFVFAK